MDSFNSIKISGSKLKPSSSINFDLLSVTKFSIISAESDGWSSFRVLFKNSASLSLIFLLKRLINSLLNSKLAFLSVKSFVKLININFYLILKLLVDFF